MCEKCHGRTFLSSLLARVVDVVLELDADLPLVRLVSDKRVFQELISGRPLSVILHQAVLDEVDELLGPDDAEQEADEFKTLPFERRTFPAVRRMF